MKLLLSAVFVCIFLTSNQPVQAQLHHPSPGPLPTPAYKHQSIALPMAGLSSVDETLLMLNNNRAGELSTTLSVFTVSGHRVALPSLDLLPSESRLIRLNGVLTKAGLSEPIGYIEAEYDGVLMELGAQLTLYPIPARAGLDSPRSLAVDFASTSRHAVAWIPPDGRATIAVSNVSEQTVTATLQINGKKSVSPIAPHETILENYVAPSEVGPSSVLAADVFFDGPKDALRVFGLIASTSSGSLPIRFYDPASSTQTSITAPAIATTPLFTHVLVRNVSTQDLTITPHWSEAGISKPHTVDGTAITVAADHSVFVPTDAMKKAAGEGIGRLTLSINSVAPSVVSHKFSTYPHHLNGVANRSKTQVLPTPVSKLAGDPGFRLRLAQKRANLRSGRQILFMQ